MTLTTVGLALKLSEHDRNLLFEGGAKPLKYFPKAPVKKQYAVLPIDYVDDESALAEWILESLAFAHKQACG